MLRNSEPQFDESEHGSGGTPRRTCSSRPRRPRRSERFQRDPNQEDVHPVSSNDINPLASAEPSPERPPLAPLGDRNSATPSSPQRSRSTRNVKSSKRPCPSIPGNSTLPRKRPAADESSASAPPAAKKARTKRNPPAPAPSAEENAQGLSPAPPHSREDASDQPEVERHYGTVLTRNTEQQQTNSEWWQYVYAIESTTQPDSYTLDDKPVLIAKPKAPHVGCRICNRPTDGEPKSAYGVCSLITTSPLLKLICTANGNTGQSTVAQSATSGGTLKPSILRSTQHLWTNSRLGSLTALPLVQRNSIWSGQLN